MRPLHLVATAFAAAALVQCGSDDATTGESTAGIEACVAAWSPTWQQRSGANEWWVEYAVIGGTASSAYLEVPGLGSVPLKLAWNKWVGASSFRIPKGTQVIVHAENALGQKAQTQPFGYLVVTSPVTDPCAGAAPDAGVVDAGSDAGAGDASSCSSAWAPAWLQRSGANEWWVEYAITGGTVKSAHLEVLGLGNVTLALTWNKWVGPSSFRIPRGTQVVVHAENSLGQKAETVPFRYLVDTAPITAPCEPAPVDAGTDAGTDAGSIAPDDVYDPSKVLTYELGFDAPAMAVLSSTLEADQKTWVHGTFKCGSITFADVGVRRKGTSTFRALPQKAAFKIRFDKYVAGQKFAGFTDLTLNNSMSDPTFLAERLSYHVFRSVGLPAQRASSAQITINGELYGLYANIETPNKQFIQRVFGANAKTLYEVNYGSQWLPGVEDGFEEDVGDGTKADVTALFGAVEKAQTATLLSDVANVLDTNEWLRFSATEAAVGHYDGYAFGVWGSHNYFMAGDVNGRFSLVPWSTDLTMSNRETVVNANQPLDTADGGPTLLGKCKQSTTCWATYEAQAKSVLATYETLDLVGLAKAWHAQIHPYVLADRKRETSDGYYASETTNLYTWLANRPSVMRAQLGIAP